VATPAWGRAVRARRTYGEGHPRGVRALA